MTSMVPLQSKQFRGAMVRWSVDVEMALLILHMSFSRNGAYFPKKNTIEIKKPMLNRLIFSRKTDSHPPPVEMYRGDHLVHRDFFIGFQSNLVISGNINTKEAVGFNRCFPVTAWDMEVPSV